MIMFKERVVPYHTEIQSESNIFGFAVLKIFRVRGVSKNMLTTSRRFSICNFIPTTVTVLELRTGLIRFS